MNEPDQSHAARAYELVDFGGGRKLERFGGVLLHRPSPAAEGFSKANPAAWRAAAARYDRDTGETGHWTALDDLPAGWPSWPLAWGDLSLELRATDFGHVGFFPEHAATWRSIGQAAGDAARQTGQPPRVLNLFAYTGGATLAAAAAGAAVVHIDAAQSVVGWARHNAELSGLADAPVRWIAEDAAVFAAREVRRGSRYDGILLDPPSYGHGPSGKAWKIDRDLPGLLASCAALLAERPRFVLFTCHTPGYDGAALAALLAEHGLAPRDDRIQSGELVLQTADGRELPSGAFAWRSAAEPEAEKSP